MYLKVSAGLHIMTGPGVKSLSTVLTTVAEEAHEPIFRQDSKPSHALATWRRKRQLVSLWPSTLYLLLIHIFGRQWKQKKLTPLLPRTPKLFSNDPNDLILLDLVKQEELYIYSRQFKNKTCFLHVSLLDHLGPILWACCPSWGHRHRAEDRRPGQGEPRVYGMRRAAAVTWGVQDHGPAKRHKTSWVYLS